MNDNVAMWRLFVYAGQKQSFYLNWIKLYVSVLLSDCFKYKIALFIFYFHNYWSSLLYVLLHNITAIIFSVSHFHM